MAISNHELFFVLFLFVNCISFTIGELLCHEHLTAVVPGKENLGVLTTSQFVISKPYYEKFNSTHFKVCICTKVPCLRKCCPLGQAYEKSYKTCHQVPPNYGDVNPEIYSPDLKLIPDYGIYNFHRVFGNTCKKGSYLLYPEESDLDKTYFLTNGKLFLPEDNILYEAQDFCLENVLEVLEDGPQNATMRVSICFPEEPQFDEKVTLYPIGLIISMPFLLATFIVYSLPELRNLHGKTLMSHVTSLLTAYIILATIQMVPEIGQTFCTVGGFFLQYAFLATFFWLNVMCFDMWMAFSGFKKFSGHTKEKENKKFIIYSLYAWGCPSVISFITVAMDYAPNIPDYIVKPEIGKSKCFLNTKLAALYYFYLPMSIVIFMDIVFFVLTALKIYKVRKETKVLKGKESRRNHEASKQRCMLYLKLFLVMGINWVMEIISWFFSDAKELFYLTDAMNSLQGLFIFWIFVCNKKIKKILIARFYPQCATRESETHTSSYKISMSGNSATLATDSIHMSNMGVKKTGSVV